MSSASTTNNNRIGGGLKTLFSPRRRNSFSKKKDEAENPYSALGREKFSALLADVEEKKRMILAEIGADEDDSDTPPPLIRFVNSEKDGKLRPVVIRANGTKYYNKGINREGVSMSMTATMTNPLKTVNLADQEQIKEHQQHQRLPEDEKEVEKEKEEEEEEDDDDEGPDFVWFGTENVKQLKSPTQPPPEPKPEENIEVIRHPCTKVCDKEEDERRSANKCEVKLLTATHSGLMNSVMKEVESSSSSSGNKLQLEASHVYVGMIVVMVLMLLLLFERYWRIYYLVEFQTKICLHEKMGN